MVKREDIQRMGELYKSVVEGKKSPGEELQALWNKHRFHGDQGDSKLAADFKKKAVAKFNAIKGDMSPVFVKQWEQKLKESVELDEACSKTKKEELDPVNQKELKKDFKDREDKDIDNDGEVDDQDEYIHNKRKAISKAVKEDTFASFLMDIADETLEEGTRERIKMAYLTPSVDQKSVQAKLDQAKKSSDAEVSFNTVKASYTWNVAVSATPKGIKTDKGDLIPYSDVKQIHVVKKMSEDVELDEAKQPNDSGSKKQEFDDNWSGSAKQMYKDSEGEKILDAEDMSSKNVEDAKDMKQASARKGDNLNNGDGKKPKSVKEFFDLLDGINEAKKEEKDEMEDGEENETEKGEEKSEPKEKDTKSGDVKASDDVSTMIKKNALKRQAAEDDEEDKETGRK